MNWKLGAGTLLAMAQIALADSTIQQAQETLKEQGFYFGQITGEKNADTTAAIRRFQIRNGLKVTGDLNEETLHALNSNSSASVQTGTPPPPGNQIRAQPTPQQNEDLRSESPQAPPTAPRPSRTREIYPAPAPPPEGSVFDDSPYATAPPQLQRQILLNVETSLRRRGLYGGQVDGAFGPELEAALRGYQSRLGLVTTGRLDMDTLASLGLLPGQRPHLPRQPYATEPPVRGEWIH